MPISYLAPENGPILQGEILGDIWEHRLLDAAEELPDGRSPRYHSFHHPLTVVLDAGCDLESDHRDRQEDPDPSLDVLGEAEIADVLQRLEARSKRMAYIHLCDLFEEGSITSRMTGGSGVLRRTLSGNQEARFHYLPEGEGGVAELVGLTVPIVFDFKRVVALPISSVYSAIDSGNATRKAVIPPEYLFDLVQRYYAYCSRIGQP